MFIRFGGQASNGELKESSRKVVAPRLRYKDMFKRHLKNTSDYENWRGKAEDRVAWRKVVAGKRLRKLEPAPPPTEAAYKCVTCNRTFKATIGLSSHMRHKH